jgi:crotonobetainyl-CoA:carnitine CoA-transferase CaiB-like acyl-CoA transferase
VLKVEPPGGDATRDWPPQRDGQGYFFALSNSDKRSLCLDLRHVDDRRRFERLLAEADVLVENLKPGALDKLGIDASTRARINPRLVYCAISGFGADSAYPGRPAFDTVVQAMSGIMDLVRVNGVPQKTGISYADVLGGLFALTATLAALIARARSGRGDAIDISMQDAAAWITQWTGADAGVAMLKCADGYVCMDFAAGVDAACPDAESLSRTQLVARLQALDIAAAPVLAVAEAAQSAQTAARGVLRSALDSAGREWPVFASPIRSCGTTAATQTAIGPLGEANARVFGE